MAPSHAAQQKPGSSVGHSALIYLTLAIALAFTILISVNIGSQNSEQRILDEPPHAFRLVKSLQPSDYQHRSVYGSDRNGN